MSIPEPSRARPLDAPGAVEAVDVVVKAEKRAGPVRLIVQTTGFVCGLGLLAWVLIDVFKPENRERISRLKDIQPADLTMLLGLSLVIVLASGETFRRVLSPVRRLGFADVQATNAIASLLALLPFKLSIVFRVLMHSGRDGVPLLTIGAWFLGVSAVIMGVLAPIMGVNALVGTVNALWFVLVGTGVLVSLTTIWGVCRYALTDRGWGMLMRLWGVLPMPGFLRRSNLPDRAHEGARMLGHAPTLGTVGFVRLLDIAAQAGRVYVAAHVLGVEMTLGTAVLAGSVYFLIGALAPTGQVGAREAGTAGLVAVVAPTLNVQTMSVLVLTISAAEVAVLLVLSLVGLAHLRPRNLFKRQAGA